MRPISIVVLSLLLLPVSHAAAGGGSHLGVAPGQIVNLISAVSPCPNQPGAYAFQMRVLADGSVGSFTIPDGTALVITDLCWTQSGTPASKVWSIYLETDLGVAIFLTGALADSSGSVTGTDHLTAGVVVKAGRTLCIKANSGIPVGMVQGYLVQSR
jgi:hypothetical protein